MGDRLRRIGSRVLGAVALTVAFAGSTAPADAIHVGSGNRQYAYATAVCEFGQPGGRYCADPRDPRDDLYDWGYWRGGVFDFADQWGYEYRNCTSYVAWRLAAAGVNTGLFRDLGNAAQWLSAVSGEAGVVINHTSSPGAVAVWESGTYGHVAWVDSVSGSSVIVSDYNYAGTGAYARRRLGRADGPAAYIHFP
ncbi:MAG: CHAP domain-containing protein [Trebonia sp.]